MLKKIESNAFLVYLLLYTTAFYHLTLFTFRQVNSLGFALLSLIAIFLFSRRKRRKAYDWCIRIALLIAFISSLSLIELLLAGNIGDKLEAITVLVFAYFSAKSRITKFAHSEDSSTK